MLVALQVPSSYEDPVQLLPRLQSLPSPLNHHPTAMSLVCFFFCPHPHPQSGSATGFCFLLGLWSSFSVSQLQHTNDSWIACAWHPQHLDEKLTKQADVLAALQQVPWQTPLPWSRREGLPPGSKPPLVEEIWRASHPCASQGVSK